MPSTSPPSHIEAISWSKSGPLAGASPKPYHEFPKVSRRREITLERRVAISYLTRLHAVVKPQESGDPSPLSEAAIATGLAILSHLLSVLVLYRLTRVVFATPSDKPFALITSSLHIISPAGLFLAAPYAEASFSFLSFSGYSLYVSSILAHGRRRFVERDVYVILAGLCLGIATTYRTNGVLNGFPFLYDAVVCITELAQRQDVWSRLRRLLSLGLGGALVGSGLVVPQWLAYRQFCVSAVESSTLDSRPWCTRSVPSIYTWVQDVYW